MRSGLAALAALLVCGGFSEANAQGFGLPCPVMYGIAYELRPVICYRAEWREEKVPCVIRRVDYRQEVTRVQMQVWMLKEFDERVRTSFYTPVPREVEREVRRCVMIPVMLFDPCTCCCYVTYYPQWISERVRCVEYDYRREEREVNVRVCRWVAEPRVVDQVRWIPVVTDQPSWTVRRYCVTVPYQSMVCVPVFVPCVP